MHNLAGNAWTAQNSDFEQQLIIDLGSVRNITRVSIQGRPHSSEYVTEFSISYGYNGLDYADYKEPGGNTKVIADVMHLAYQWQPATNQIVLAFFTYSFNNLELCIFNLII